MKKTNRNSKKAVAIVRVSSQRQEQNTSRESQRNEIERYCLEAGLELLRVEEIVESAKTSNDRRKFMASVARVQAEEIPNLVFHRHDRMTRNLADAEFFETLIMNRILVVHFALERKRLDHLTSDSDFFMNDIHAANAKHYSRELSSKVQRAMRTKALRGWYPSNNVPLGYAVYHPISETGQKIKGTATVVQSPDTKAVAQVRREFELHAEGHSYNAIYQKVCDEQLVSLERKRSYSKSAVECRVKNPFYRGHFEWQGESFEGKHPIIIDKKTLDQVDARLNQNRRGYTLHAKGIFGGGWLTCAECGCNIVFDPKRKTLSNGEPKEFHYYHCTDGRKQHQGQRGRNVLESAVWDQFGEAVGRITLTKELASEIAEAMNRLQSKAKDGVRKQIREFGGILESIDRELEELYPDYKRGLLTEDDFKLLREKSKEKRRMYVERLEAAQLELTDTIVETARSVLELATDLKSLWNEKTPEERKSDLNKLLSNPRLNGKSLEYDYRKPFDVLVKMNEIDNWWPRAGSNCRP